MVILIAGQLALLAKDVKRSQHAAYVPGTHSNLRTQWRALLSFCIYFNLDYLPISLDTLALYVQFLSRTFKSVGSIKNYVNGAKLMHLLAGLEFPHVSTFEYKLLIRGLGRLNPHVPRRALPMTPDILRRLVQVLDLEDSAHLSFWSCALLAFYLMARKASLLPQSLAKFHRNKHLLRQDIILTDSMMLVSIRCTKTLQFGGRIVTIPILASPGSPLCPVDNFTKLCKLVPARALDSAFSFWSCGRLTMLTHTSFIAILKKSLLAAGINPEGYTGHSFRRGGATWAFKANIPGELIQIIGDWASDAYKLYLDHDLSTKLLVAQKIKESLSQF